MEYDRIGIFLIWKRPEMDLPEMDRFQMPEMDYSLGNKKKEKRLWKDDRWDRGVSATSKTEKKGGGFMHPRGIEPGSPRCGFA